jgi:hypothetical protein
VQVLSNLSGFTAASLPDYDQDSVVHTSLNELLAVVKDGKGLSLLFDS